MSETKTWHGDCLELMKNIPDGSVDMVLCDLPYGMTNNDWDKMIPFDKLWEQWYRVAKPEAAIVLHCMQPFTTKLIASNMKDFKYCLVWDKVYATGFLNAKKQPLRSHEDIAVFYRKQCTYNPVMTKSGVPHYCSGNAEGRTSLNYGSVHKSSPYLSDEYFPTDIIRFPNSYIVGSRGGGKTHPTAKPQPLLEYLVKTYTNLGDTVLDNTMGSGSTGVACVHTGRNFLGIEQSEEYYKIAVERIEQAKTDSLFLL